MKEEIATISVNAASFRDEALQAFRDNGAVVLKDLDTLQGDGQSWESLCANVVPTLLFDAKELLLKQHTASAVHLEQDGISELRGKALPPHTDGYVWGSQYPDVIFLVCEACDSSGGENYLIDGHAILKKLKSATVEILKQSMVDHTERSGDGMAQGVTAINPVLQFSETGELLWRRMVAAKFMTGHETVDGTSYVSLWQPTVDDNAAEVMGALKELDDIIYQEDLKAPRFRLQRGEVLIVNNYRMLHARESFSISDRRTWRIWAWTTNSNGLPPDVTDEAPATVRTAEKFIRETIEFSCETVVA